MSWHGETRGNKGGFFRCFLPTPMTDWAKIFTGLLFDIEVVVHKVWTLENTVYRNGPMALKQVYNYSYCQRPASTLYVRQHSHEVIKLWKFQLIGSSESQQNSGLQKHFGIFNVFRSRKCIMFRLMTIFIAMCVQSLWVHLKYRGEWTNTTSLHKDTFLRM